MRILHYGDLEIGVESADGAAHEVRIQVQPPAGLQAADEAQVTVPPTGRVATRVRLWRSSAPRGSRQALVVVATVDGAPEPSVSAAAAAFILPDPAWMKHLRRPLGVLALLLMAAAALVELRRRR